MNRPTTQTVFALLLLLSLTGVAIAQTSSQGGVGKPVGPAKPTETAPTVLPTASTEKDKRKSSSSTTSRAAAKPLTPRQVPQTPRPLTKRLTLRERGVAIRHPEGWTVAPKRLQNLEELIYVSPDVTAKQAVSSLKITSETRRSHAEALRRLKEIAFGIGAPSTAFLNVGNWPGFQYRRIEERPQPGEGEGGPRFADEKVLRVTTAAAAGNLLVRVEAALPSDADAGLIAEVEAIGRSLTFASKTIRPFQTEEELDEIRSNPRPDNVEPPPQKPDQVETKEPNASLTTTPEQSFATGFTQRVFNGGQGELEIAVSPNARNIVVGRQGDFRTSNDGGQTFPFSGVIPFTGGDPSLAWGQSGNFYYAGILGGCVPADAAGPNGYTCSGVARSTNNGQTFPNIFNANRCANNNNPAPPNLAGFCFPDQEHIAADRVNAGTGGGDQIYVTWRNFDATDQDPALVCSQDSGVNWTAVPITVGTGAFPRINAGQDGFVYVVYLDGGNYMLNKYSSCASGMVQQVGFPVAVTTRSPVTCPFPGHDRCDQNPSSQMIAVDDTNPNHVYFVAGHNTAGNNDDIRVRDSLDGGLTWPGPRFVRVNSLVSGHRIMPWLCTTGGEAFVTWYDRRSAPPTNNDLTDYYGGRVSLDAGGNLVVGPETKISEVGDPWCASGWPCGTRSTGDSEQCSVQPQQAGVCCGPAIPGNNCPGSNQRCDFSDMNCPAGETCSTGGGCPKYGDYNGNACAAGRLLAAYASMATPLRIQPPSNGISVLFAASLVGDVPQIQVPGSVSVADTCVGSSSTATMNVCNTGKANLEIAPAITSSNSQFVVTTPSAGYPVVISPDFCFPFQVRFTPTSTGSKTANLTIESNDPSTNPVIVQATALASQQNISTFIADNGDFGNVCVGSFKDLDLTINNSGGCNLVISNITSSSAEFKTAQTMSFPIVVQGGTSVHVPIRLQPTTTGVKSANISIATNDPFVPLKVVAVTGHADPGDIRVTGSTDFGDVCAGGFAEKTVQVCNVGTCDLHVASASLGSCTDFQLVNNPFPATISHDSCIGVAVRFTPTSAGPKSCTLTINSDDPDSSPITKTVTANTPLASIDVSPDQNFPPEVIQSTGMCRTLQPFPISNKGTCNLTITSITTGGTNGTDFSTSGLPSFPIILQPGHTVGDGNLMTVFAPTAMDRDRLGTLSVTYESDPITHASVQVVRNLCGEGVLTGARVLVTAGGVPVSTVEKLQINRITGNRNKDQVDSVDTAMNLALQTVNPAPPCASFQYHREYGTVSNPIQLLPGSYVLTATAIVNGTRQNLTVAFDITTCDFNPTIVINFP